MDVSAECRRRLEALELDVSDSRATLETLKWGMEMLRMLSSRVSSSVAELENVAPGDIAEGSKKRAAEPLQNPNRKYLKGGRSTISLEEFLEMIDNGELGDWMRQRVTTYMKSSECSSLVGLIDHCLLLSLDQSPGDELPESSSENYWLHAWIVKEVISDCAKQDSIEFPPLDWLLAYLTSTRPDMFVPVLLDTGDGLQPRSLVSYAQKAPIFDFASISAPELLVPTVVRVFGLIFESIQADHESVQRSVYDWIVQAALCPDFLAVVAKALTSCNFNVETAETMSKILLTANSRQVAFPPSWTKGLHYRFDGLPEIKAWWSFLIVKHADALSSIATELVLLLGKIDIPLLEWLNNRLSFFVTPQEAKQNSIFLRSLSSNVHCLWKALLSRCPSAVCECSASLFGCRICKRKDQLLQTCQIALLSSEDDVVAELLAQTTVFQGRDTDRENLQILVKLMHILRVMLKGQRIFKMWADTLIQHLRASQCHQVLVRVQAIRQLADPLFWEQHVCEGWKPSWRAICDALSERWLIFLALLHREESHEVSLNLLAFLHSLITESLSSSEAAADRLKAALGLFLYRLCNVDLSTTSLVDGSERCWSSLRETALLRKIIVELACYSADCFTLLVTFLVDFSLETSLRRQLRVSANYDILKSEHLMSRPGFQIVVSLAPNKVNRYGKVEHFLAPSSEMQKEKPKLLSEENCCRAPGGALTSSRNQMKTTGLKTDMGNSQATDSIFAELCGLLVHCAKRCLERFQAKSVCWPSHPAELMSKLLAARLETPHDTAITMEQYEEVLPKHVSLGRHAFLIECFRENLLLFKVLELVMEYGQEKELRACTEFVRALLADSICGWHTAIRIGHATERDRNQILNVIQLVNFAKWLPQPLSSCCEIISLITAEDITTLLFIIWRCMHDKLKAPGSQMNHEDNLCNDWEAQFFSILRHNISRVGAHFARLSPHLKA